MTGVLLTYRRHLLAILAGLILAALPVAFGPGGLTGGQAAWAQRHNQDECDANHPERCPQGGSGQQNGSDNSGHGGGQQPWQQLLDPNRPNLSPEQERALIDNGWRHN